jgi:hypothetical protein
MGKNFRRKAGFVADGHKTRTPEVMTYLLVVSRGSVRIDLTIAALNDLDIMACDIQNAYLPADCREKCWTAAGPEFGSEAGLPMIIKKALYGLNSSGAAFRAHLAEALDAMDYKPSYADPDVWLRPAVKPDGFKYYEYILCYVDDVLSIFADPKKTMRRIRGLGIERRQDRGARCLYGRHDSEYVTQQRRDVLDYVARTICKGGCH